MIGYATAEAEVFERVRHLSVHPSVQAASLSGMQTVIACGYTYSPSGYCHLYALCMALIMVNISCKYCIITLEYFTGEASMQALFVKRDCV